MRKKNQLAPLKVLIIQENLEYTDLVRDRLNQEPTVTFHVRGATSLAEGLKWIQEQAPDIILVELSLQDSQGLATFNDLQHAIPRVPIVVLTSMDNEMLALQAVRSGAQDYVLKGEVGGQILPRVIYNAVERQRKWSALKDMTLTDDLTGLYNRRGFLILAQQQLKLAKRNKKGLLLFLADVDRFKQINDECGHPQGDVALTRVAQILIESFRKSDIVTRIGGDEFAVIAIEAMDEHIPLLLARVNENLKHNNAGRQYPYELSLSFGVSAYDFEKTVFVEQLLAKADKELYRNKRMKKKARQVS